MIRLFSALSVKGRFRQEIEDFAKKLGSETIIDPKACANCHEMRLVMEKNPEHRLRSIQTLAQLKTPTGIGPAVNDLIGICKNWPRKGVAEHSWHLASALKDLLGTEQDDPLPSSISPE